MGDIAWLRALDGAMVIFTGFRATGHPHCLVGKHCRRYRQSKGRRRLSSFRVYLRRPAAGYGFLVNLKSKKSLLPSQGDEMKIHPE